MSLLYITDSTYCQSRNSFEDDKDVFRWILGFVCRMAAKSLTPTTVGRSPLPSIRTKNLAIHPVRTSVSFKEKSNSLSRTRALTPDIGTVTRSSTMPLGDTGDALRRSMIIGTPSSMRKRQLTIETDIIRRQESLEVSERRVARVLSE